MEKEELEHYIQCTDEMVVKGSIVNLSQQSRKLQQLQPIKHGDWLFTCSNKPLQFDRFEPKDRAKLDFNESEIENELFYEFDDFITIEGSSHSVGSCSLKPITNSYAEWFNEHEIWEIFEQDKDRDKYELAVKQLCQQTGLEFEGV